VGGLFLIWKATKEIHEKIDLKQEHGHQPSLGRKVTLTKVVWQIMILDIIFSLDSVVTAVGMAKAISVMVAANVLALAVMLLASKPIADFVENYPSVKILALAFLMTIGIVLVGESFEIEIPKGYVYFGMGFSLFVEMLNIRIDQVERKRAGLSRTEQVDQSSAV
jgi:predicted tellurium resistance membrane protein TerC